MARRYNEIKGLAELTAKTIVSDEEQWKKFLHTAGHMYKYPFKEQMLIYAQRPDATGCASLELWNEKMNCWVNKGAQGIALIDEEGVHRSGLKYVFDVKDVHEARFIGHKPKLWKMYSMPLSDILTFLIALFLIIQTYRELRGEDVKKATVSAKSAKNFA